MIGYAFDINVHCLRMEISYCKLIRALCTCSIFCCSELFNALTDASLSNESWLRGKNSSNQSKISSPSTSPSLLLSSKNDLRELQTENNSTLLLASSFTGIEPDNKDLNFNHQTSKDIPRLNFSGSLLDNNSNGSFSLFKDNSTLQVGLIENLHNLHKNSLHDFNRSSVYQNASEHRVNFAKNPSDIFADEYLIEDALVTDYSKKNDSQDQTLNGDLAGGMTPEEQRLKKVIYPTIFSRVLSAQHTVRKRFSKNVCLGRQVSSSNKAGRRVALPCKHTLGEKNLLTLRTEIEREKDCDALRAFPDKMPKNCRAQHIPCGHRQQYPTPIIVGGKDAEPRAWPWMAGIYTKAPELSFKCGASIINTYYVLTAGHCVDKNRTYVILVGSVKANQGDSHVIDKVTLHSNYKDGNVYDDIAVVRVKKPFRFGKNIQPICLPTDPVFTRKKLNGGKVTIIGWGLGTNRDKHAYTLQEADVRVVDVPSCKEAYKDKKEDAHCGITNHFICAGVPTRDKDACMLDSGGPLMIPKKGVWHLIGIVLFGDECAETQHPGAYTLVTNYLDWLQKVATVL